MNAEESKMKAMYKKIQETIWEKTKEDILLEVAFEYKNLNILKNLDLKNKKDKILEIAKKTEHYYLLCEIKGIDWNDKKEEILEIVKESNDFDLLYRIKGIDWSDKKEEIWEIAKENNKLILLSEIKGIDWSDKKKETGEIVKESNKLALLSGVKGIDWRDKKEEVWKIIKENKDLGLLYRIEGIDWNDKKEEIWKIAKESNKIGLLSGIKGIDWSDKKEEIWEIAKKSNNISFLGGIKGIDWSDKKEEIWEMAKKRENLGLVSEIKGIDWSDKKEEIWKIARKSEKFYLLYRIEGIDWTDKKEEIWEIAKENNDFYLLYRIEGIDWSDKKEEIWKVSKEKIKEHYSFIKNSDSIYATMEESRLIGTMISQLNKEFNSNLKILYTINGMDWNDRKKEILEIAKEIKSLKVIFLCEDLDISGEDFQVLLENVIQYEKPDLYKTILKIQKENNPVYIKDLQNFIQIVFPSFDNKMIINSLNEKEKVAEKLEKNKSLTLKLMDSLKNVGILKDLLNSENENIKKVNEILSEVGSEVLLEIDESTLDKYVRSLDVTKKEDAIELLVIERTFLNKWAHNIENYIRADILYNLPEDDVLKGIREQQNNEIIKKKNEIKQECAKLIYSGEFDSDSFKKLLKTNGINYTKIKNHEAIVTAEEVSTLIANNNVLEETKQVKSSLKKYVESILAGSLSQTKKSSINNQCMELVDKGKFTFNKLKKILKENEINYDEIEKPYEISSAEKLSKKIADMIGKTVIKLNKYIDNLLSYNGIEKDFDRYKAPTRIELCDKYFSRYRHLREEYYKAVKLYNEKNGVKTLSFSDCINQFLDSSQTIKPYLKHLKTENGKGIDEEIEDFFTFVRHGKYLDNLSINELFKRSAEYLDLIDDCFNAKQAITSTLITTVKEQNVDDLICMRKAISSEGRNDVLDIFLNNHIQIFGGHFDSNSDTVKNPHFEDIKEFELEADEVSRNLNCNDYIKTYAHIGKIPEAVKESFKELEQTIRKIEGKNPEKRSEYKALEKLKKLKTTKPDEYDALKIRILLGAGLDRFKDFYGMEERENNKRKDDDSNKRSISNNIQNETVELIEDLKKSIRIIIDVTGNLEILQSEGFSQSAIEYAKKLLKEKENTSVDKQGNISIKNLAEEGLREKQVDVADTNQIKDMLRKDEGTLKNDELEQGGQADG